jgi:hypothetical protein
MAVDISAEVTRIWPTTETTLATDDDVDYAAQKARAIAKAKRLLYGTATVDAEADIPELAAYWIADQACVLLIPLAKDYYMSKQRLSDAKEGATITYYNKVTELDRLKQELDAGLAGGKQDALDAISSAAVTDDIPATSVNGLMIDPLERAMMRGPL